MARGEDLLISAIFNKLPSVSISIDEFDIVIPRQLSLLQSNGFNPIVLYGNELHRKFYESKNYEPKWRATKTGPKELKHLDGFYNESLVIRYPGNPNTVVICDITEFGDLVQYKVDEEKPDFPLSFSIKEISEEQAKEYLVKNPELAKHPDTGKVLLEKDALRRIQQDVELAIWQRFEVENINPKAGIVINFGNNDNKEDKS